DILTLAREHMDYRGVSPFTNYLPLDLFIGRQKELNDIHSAFREGVRSVVIVGSGGVGKTSLARAFADRFKDEFPGGVSAGNASLAERPDDLLRRVVQGQPATGPRLVVLDDAEALDEAGVRTCGCSPKSSQTVVSVDTCRSVDRVPTD